MSDSNKMMIPVPDEILEQMRCSVCTQYLSCAPIQVLPDGKSICGNCRPGSEESGYRNLNLETILSKVYFPCKYQNYGCKERLLFGEGNQHQSTCDYREFPCPATECLWKGALEELQKHFSENHPDAVLEKAEFKLNIEENKEEIVMVVIHDTNFMLTYQFNAAACHFYHDIRYFNSVKEASCKIRVLNNSDHDYCVMAKGNPAQIYDYGFYNKEVSNVLDITKLLPALNQPNEIMVVIDLKFVIDDSRLLKCTRCHNCLSIPIFEDHGDTICANCWYLGISPASNNDVINQVVNSVIPCCWNNCSVIQKGDRIRKHEKNCKNRVYKCARCDESVDLFEMDSHIKTDHSNYNVFVSPHNYVVNYSGCVSVQYFYTRVENEFVFIVACNYSTKHLINIVPTRYSNNITTTIVVGHSHCNKSKKFNVTFAVDTTVKITLDMLPECFKSINGINVNLNMHL